MGVDDFSKRNQRAERENRQEDTSEYLSQSLNKLFKLAGSPHYKIGIITCTVYSFVCFVFCDLFLILKIFYA